MITSEQAAINQVNIPMTVPLTDEEASLIRYALRELAQKRWEQSLDGKRTNSEWSEANEKEARQLDAISNRISSLQRSTSP